MIGTKFGNVVTNDRHLLYLVERWSDERGYEDWAEYEKSAAKHLKKTYGATLVRSSKRPVTFIFRKGRKEYQYKATSRMVTLRSKPIAE